MTSSVVGPSLLGPNRYDQPTGVDCPAVGWCLALDGDTAHLQLQILANGIWTARAITPPGSAANGTPLLTSVDCVAIRRCVAVGQYLTDEGPRALVVTLDGRRISFGGVPDSLRFGDSSGLSAVSCAAVTYCAASGYQSVAPTTILWQRTADGWADALPAGPSLASVDGLSCAPAVCVAAATTAAGDHVVFVRSGNTWTAKTPAGAPTVTAVDCYAARSCVLVGAGDAGPVTERYTGANWRAQPLPAPPSGVAPAFDKVSCASNGRCVAAGPTYAAVFTAGSARTVDLPHPHGATVSQLSCGAAGSCLAGGTAASRQWADRLSNGVWTPQRIPLPAEVGQESSAMFGMSCAGSGFCVVQGAAFGASDRVDTLVTVAAAPPAFDLHALTVPSDAATDPRSNASGVSCRADGACVAIGQYRRPDESYPSVFVTSTASGQSVVPAPAPADGTPESIVLNAISCATPGRCVAVGAYTDADGERAGLIETRTDGVWTAFRAPDPVGGSTHFLTLSDVACGTFCAAVGSSVPGRTGAGVIITDRGGLHAEPVTMPAGTTLGRLQTVACPPTGACTAIGVASNGRAVFLYSSTGGWKGGYLAAPAGQDAATVTTSGALDCSSDGNCVILGRYAKSGGGFGLVADDVDNGVMTAVDIPVPFANLTQAAVLAVSCPADLTCAAVVGAAGGPVLLRRVDGAWSATRAPVPADALAGGSAPQLSDISCVSPARCVAVGMYQQRTSGRQRPLVVTFERAVWSAAGRTVPPGFMRAADEGLDSLACAASTCVSVGEYVSADLTSAVLARRDG